MAKNKQAAKQAAKQPSPQQQSPTDTPDDRFVNRVNALMRGEEQPPSPLVGELVEMMRDTFARAQKVGQDILNMQQTLEEARAMAQRLEGERDGYLKQMRRRMDAADEMAAAAAAPKAPKAPKAPPAAAPAAPEPTPAPVAEPKPKKKKAKDTKDAASAEAGLN